MKINKLHTILIEDTFREYQSYMLIKPDDTVLTDSEVLLVLDSKSLFDPDFLSLLPKEGILVHKSIVAKLNEDNIPYLEYNPKESELEFNVTERKFDFTIKVKVKSPGWLSYPAYMAVIPAKESLVSIETIAIGDRTFPKLFGIFKHLQLQFTGKNNAIPIRVGSEDRAFVKHLIAMPVMIQD